MTDRSSQHPHSEVRGLIVADDLTGANDTGHQFAARGYETTVAMTGDHNGRRLETTDVLVTNTDSRYITSSVAAERVKAVIEQTAAAVVYKKIDSTLRGNLVAEIQAAGEVTNAGLVLVAPAFPETGRITVGGIHVVDGTPVAETAAGADPEKPVVDSHIPTLLAELESPIETVSLSTVDGGADAAETHLRSLLEDHTDSTGESLVVVCDAARSEHLEAIASAGARLETSVLYVGSGGLARYVRLDGEADDDGGGVLGIVGSVNPRTFAQLAAVPDELVVSLDIDLAMADRERGVREVSSRTRATLAEHGTAVITSATTTADVEATLEAGQAHGLTETQIRERVASVLGESARAVAEDQRVTGLFATGGEVATQVLSSLEADGVRLTGQAVTAGVPVMELVGGPAEQTPLITKAGAFGETETIYKSLVALSRYNGN